MSILRLPTVTGGSSRAAPAVLTQALCGALHIDGCCKVASLHLHRRPYRRLVGARTDDRRTILEEQSHHIAIGLRYLPAIARRLLPCRDLGTEEPFDFLGFLDFAPPDEGAFDDMLGQLRATREWTFFDREIDIRLIKA